MADLYARSEAPQVPAVMDSRQAFLPNGYRLLSPRTRQEYQIIRTLNNGGFGITYEGTATATGMRVAIKELFPAGVVMRNPDYTVADIGQEGVFEKMSSSFLKEANVLASLRDISSVVDIYDYFSANNTAYYVMEYISGSNLLDVIRRQGPLNVQEYQPRFRQLMRDIESFHNRGVIHRDISPDNIMLTSDGRFIMIDFGSARKYNSGQNLTINVKQNFAPIEQYNESGQGTFTDVYALAATMYYCYTGKAISSALSRLRRDDLLSPVMFGAKLNPAQEQALFKALAVRPENRFQTMQEFEDAYFQNEPGPNPQDLPIHDDRPAHISGSLQEAILKSWNNLIEEPVLPILSGAFLLAALIAQLFL